MMHALCSGAMANLNGLLGANDEPTAEAPEERSDNTLVQTPELQRDTCPADVLLSIRSDEALPSSDAPPGDLAPSGECVQRRVQPKRKSALQVASKVAAITEWETCSETSSKFREIASMMEAEFAAEKRQRGKRKLQQTAYDVNDSDVNSDASCVSQDSLDAELAEKDACSSTQHAEMSASDSEFVPSDESSDSESDLSEGAEESDVQSVDEDDISDIADSNFGASQTPSEDCESPSAEASATDL
jgi:hypothetical protein